MVLSSEITSAVGLNNNDYSLLSMGGIFDFANSVEIKGIKHILEQQMSYNLAIAEQGQMKSYGANLGTTILGLWGNDVKAAAIAKVSAGSDAGMNGCEMR